MEFLSNSNRNSSVTRQKSESQNGCFKKKSTSNFPKNEHFLPSDTLLHVRGLGAGGGWGWGGGGGGVRNVRFS